MGKEGKGIEIIYRGDGFYVCFKHSGVCSEEDEGNGVPGLMRCLTGEKEIYPVNRLDRLTSGLCICASGKNEAARFSKLVSEGRLCKEYVCIVSGVPAQKNGTWEDMLFFDRRQGKSYLVDKARKGVKWACLDYWSIKSVDAKGGPLSLLRIVLHSGRTHQIRVQCSSRMMPVAGDGKYGSKINCSLALLSYKLSFEDKNGNDLTFTSPFPDCYPWNLFGMDKIDIE